ncbi:MAG: hypothetical protein LAO07_08265 [Acidobacteriia bacterium]|nr:hypothetical protein [Terriglobia bacterium]
MRGGRTGSTVVVIAMLLAAFATPAFSQAPADESKRGSAPGDDVSALKQMVAEQQKQIEALRSTVNAMRQKLDQAGNNSLAAWGQAGSVGEVASTTPVIPKSAEKSENASETLAVAVPLGIPAAHPAPKEGDEASPLQFRIGSAYVTPVGFMDFTSVFRSHDGASSIGTNFASIPYGNIYQTNLSEFRLSMQNSRVGFRVDADVKGAHVIGYMESDFLGNNPGNVEVSSNSNTMRSRLYWVDVRKNKWEILGGQTWSLLTPGRSGISPLPGDIFFTQNIDVNYQLGLFWGRIPELRFVYHPSKKAAIAFAVESPEQYAGGSAGGGLVTFPSALATAYAGELNTGGNTFGVPNVAPDFIVKLALDPSKKFHFEVGGIERNFKVWNPTNSNTYSAAGGGGFVNLNFELFKGFRLLTNNFISDGGGRYIFGQAPDLIAHADGSISLIHASSTVSGFEYTNKNSLFYAYYGGLYVGRNMAIDTDGKPVGYGFTGAGAGQNRAIQEGTFGFNQTLWKDAKWGAINLMGQYSYLTRNPWYVASGQPSNASVNMVFFNLRYSLPGSAPTLGK